MREVLLLILLDVRGNGVHKFARKHGHSPIAVPGGPGRELALRTCTQITMSRLNI